MAIVNMNKISIVGLEAQKSQILKLLMKKGFVQIDDSSFLTQEEEFGAMLQKDGKEAEVIELEQKMFQVSQAIETVAKSGKMKKAMFAPKNDFVALSAKQAELTFQEVLEINDLNKELSALKGKENSVLTSKELLHYWSNLDVPLNQLETKFSKMVLGTLPASVDINAVREKLNEKAPECVADIISTDKQITYSYVIAHKDVFDTVMQELKEFSFSPVTLEMTDKTPSQRVKEYEIQLLEIEKEKAAIASKIQSHQKSLSAFENLYDYFTVEKDEKKVVDRLVKTKSTFCLNGWLPSEKADIFIKELTAEYDCYIETEKGNREEGFPILLKNNKLVTPFEDITNMYSTPSPKDIDPSAIMSVFYIIFFGMMLADAGYGLLIALACGFIVFKSKMKKGEGNLIKMMGICGISTAVWGFIFGGFFGVTLPSPLNPLEDVMFLMAMSLVFGIVHIYIGLGIKGYTLLREGDVLGFFADIILWYIFITGVCLLIVPIVAGDIGVLADVGKYMAIIGAVGIVLTGGRSYKGIPVKLFKGVTSLYGITGYFGDILSYTRLMALCLSSGVIGQVVNLLGAMAGPVGIVLIGLIGHAINLFIGALGAYVHTSRLQFVEFFGKFYEGGGIPFSPFKFKTKYTNIN